MITTRPEPGDRVQWRINRERVITGTVVDFASPAVARVRVDAGSELPEQNRIWLAGWSAEDAATDRIWPFLWMELSVLPGSPRRRRP